MRKLTVGPFGSETAPASPLVFERQVLRSGTSRVVTQVPEDKLDLFHCLTQLLPEPFFVLYVLHTPRGEGEPGRYQSPQLSRPDLDGFLIRHASFFADDARHDLWVHSPASAQTLVWDRHNLLFAEGEPLGGVLSVLSEQGFEGGKIPELGEHNHHYRSEYDAEAADILAEFDWHWTPLRPEDEQLPSLGAHPLQRLQ